MSPSSNVMHVESIHALQFVNRCSHNSKWIEIS